MHLNRVKHIFDWTSSAFQAQTSVGMPGGEEKPDPILVDDSFDEPQNEFGLFQAYREGNLDLQVLSTQRVAVTATTTATNTQISSNASDPSVIPHSWTAAKSNQSASQTQLDKILTMPRTLGALCKPSTALLPTNLAVSSADLGISRAPYSAPTCGPSADPPKLSGGSAILVNQRQRGNPLLRHIHHVAWEYADVEPDYVVGRNNCVYFLSLRYHNLNSEYIFERLRQTKQNYQLSVLLVLVDVTDPHFPLKELCKLCLTEKLTLMLAWSSEEAARYLEAYKALENKPPDGLMPESASASDHVAQITEFLTTVRRITKADAATAITQFKTVADMIMAEKSQLEVCSGFGEKKAETLHSIFRMPFLRDTTK